MQRYDEKYYMSCQKVWVFSPKADLYYIFKGNTDMLLRKCYFHDAI